MGLSVKGGQLTSPTSTGNAAVTGVGFQGKLLILYTTVASGDAAFAPTYGVAASSSQRWAVSGESYYAAPGPIGPIVGAARILNSSKCFQAAYYDEGPVITTFLAADFVSWDSDGFTLNWTTVQFGGYPVNYLVIGGSDLSVAVGTTDTGTSLTNVSVTGLSFQPKAVLFASSGVPSEDGAGYTGDATVGLGATTSSSARFHVSAQSATGATSDASGVLHASKAFILGSETAGVYGDGDFVSMNSDGFTYSVTTMGATQLRLGYVALGGSAQYKVGTFSSPASTGNQAVTGVGFQPSVALMMSAGQTSGSSYTTHGRFALGAAISSSDRGAIWSAQKDAVAVSTPSEWRVTTRSKSITFTADDASTVQAEADFVSHDSDGFTNNWTTADATARVIGYLAMGGATVGSSGQVNNYFYRRRR